MSAELNPARPNNIVTVRVTDEMKSLIQGDAQRLGCSAADIIRFRLASGCVPEMQKPMGK